MRNGFRAGPDTAEDTRESDEDGVECGVLERRENLFPRVSLADHGFEKELGGVGDFVVFGDFGEVFLPQYVEVVDVARGDVVELDVGVHFLLIAWVENLGRGLQKRCSRRMGNFRLASIPIFTLESAGPYNRISSPSGRVMMITLSG